MISKISTPRYLYPDVSPLRVCGYGVGMGFKYQPVRLIQVASPLPLAVTCQLMIVPWIETQVFKTFRHIHISEPSQKQHSPPFAQLFAALPFVLSKFP